MPYDTLSAADRSRTHVFLPPIATQQKRFLSGIRLLWVCSLVGIAWTTVRLCVWFGTGLWGFYFLNHVCFWTIKVWCHVAGSRKGVDRRCYDWTETNDMFRLLIGICGSHLSWYTEPFPAITYVFLVLIFFKNHYLLNFVQRSVLCSQWWLFLFSWNYRLNLILMSIYTGCVWGIIILHKKWF